MGILDQMIAEVSGGSAQAGEAPALPRAMQALLGQGQASGLAGLVQRFESAGLGHLIQSWIGNGPNQSISPQQVHQALGDEKVQQMSNESGLPVAQLLGLLAQHLPSLVDRLTPNGTMPPAEERPAGRLDV